MSVSGLAQVSRDRARIHELYAPDWRAWFGELDEVRDGGPDDPRIALILVSAESVIYMKQNKPAPVVLFEVAKGIVTGTPPDVGEVRTLTTADLRD